MQSRSNILTVASIPHKQVRPVAEYLERHRSALRRWESIITVGIIASANREILSDDLSLRFRTLVLIARPDLIDRETIAALSDDGPSQLVSAHQGQEVRRILAYALVRRDFGASNGDLFRSMPTIILGAAIDAVQENEIKFAWKDVIAANCTVVLETDWPTTSPSTTSLAIGLSLLRFPISERWTPEMWTGALSSIKDDVVGEDRVRLQAYLLRVALRNMTPATWKLLSYVLPQLRSKILQGVLPNDVYQMLVDNLPSFYSVAYWDINMSRLRPLGVLGVTSGMGQLTNRSVAH